MRQWCWVLMLMSVSGPAWAQDSEVMTLAPTVEATLVYDHRFVPAPMPSAEIERLANYPSGWVGLKLATDLQDSGSTWGSFASLGVRVEPPSPGRFLLVPMVRVGFLHMMGNAQENWLLQWLFEYRFGLSGGIVLSERGSVAAGRFGVNSKLGIFVFELVTELDTARRAPRWILSGGVGF